MQDSIACSVVGRAGFPGRGAQLLTEPDERGGAALIGARCQACGKLMFPPRIRCADCYGVDMSATLLSRTGRVLSCTVVRQRPGGYQGPLPYVLGQVDLGGVTVLAHLVGRDPLSWAADDMVESCAVTHEGGDGPSVRTYAFRHKSEAGRPGDASDESGSTADEGGRK